MLSPQQAIEYPCPTCKAKANQRCVNQRGQSVSHVHSDRKCPPLRIAPTIRKAIKEARKGNTDDAVGLLSRVVTRASIADDTADTIRGILRQMRNDDQGGYLSYSDGAWNFISTSLGQVSPQELDQLFLFADLVPDEIEPLGDCSECANAKVSVVSEPDRGTPHISIAELKLDRRERGYLRPCSACKRPQMSHFVPIEISDKEAYGAFEGLIGERRTTIKAFNGDLPAIRIRVLIGRGVCTVDQVNDLRVYSVFSRKGNENVWETLHRIRTEFAQEPNDS